MKRREGSKRENVVIAPDWLMDAAIALVAALVVGAIAGAVIRAAGLRWTVALLGLPAAALAWTVHPFAGICVAVASVGAAALGVMMTQQARERGGSEAARERERPGLGGSRSGGSRRRDGSAWECGVACSRPLSAANAIMGR